MFRLKRHERRVKLLFLLPAVCWILFFTIFPLLYSLHLSFFHYRFGKVADFVGFGNYHRALTDSEFWHSLITSFKLVAFVVGIEVFLGVLIALLFNREWRGRKYWRALTILPIFTTPVGLGYLGLTIFYEQKGPLNNVLNSLGFSQINWLSHPTVALISVGLLDIWEWTPFCFIITLAGLQAIPKQVLEAGYLDCKPGWQLFRWIIFPLLWPVIMLILFLRVIESCKMFDVIFSLTGGGPGRASEVFSLYCYRIGFKFFDLGYASALSYIFLIIMIVILIFFFDRLRETYGK